MTRTHRILVEILVPVPLGAMAIAIMSRHSESLVETAKAIPIFLLVAYGLGIFPSLIYTLIMEIWFHKKLNERFGLAWTVCLSSLSGFIAGLSICALSTKLTQPTTLDYLRFSGIGFVVGIVLGYCVASCSSRRERLKDHERVKRNQA